MPRNINLLYTPPSDSSVCLPVLLKSYSFHHYHYPLNIIFCYLVAFLQHTEKLITHVHVMWDGRFLDNLRNFGREELVVSEVNI